ncbi:DUF4862 family protein [Paenibacillus sp.]|uniref:DUF4862 family protein n=1 Tax=Paenibacillus sp. TaxID=58172 RepID=UPI002837E425|nr:DUF4862 family protein [Paenibacillus sp.]MDR0270823.1 DUF4862 family protein [Paenibacillus sp.]
MRKLGNKYLVSAYATSPCFDHWDPSVESNYFTYLSQNPHISGIEHPFFLNSNKYPIEWMLRNTPDHWNMALTILPALMEISKTNPDFGLASKNEIARSKAIALIEDVKHYVARMNQLFNRTIIGTIHIQSSPRNNDGILKGSQDSFYRSLQEIEQMGWGDIQINIEHCDAFNLRNPVDKGFLPIEQELEIIKELQFYGMVLNWGRSTIETRSSVGPLKHIQLSKEHLKGFIFSGCTNNSFSEYGEWIDSHIPPRNFIDSEYLKSESLLGYEEIKSTLCELNDKDIYYGIKVLDKNTDKHLERSIGINHDTIRAIEYVHKSIS